LIVQRDRAQQGECLPEQRQRLILDRLASEGRVVAQQLAQQFGTSEDTIRRDLRELAAAGRCQRVYGGALPLSVSPASTPLSERVALAPARKQALGVVLAGLLPARQTVFVDAGSTNLAAVRALPDGHELTIVTNSPLIAAAAASRDAIELILIGGLVDRRSGAAFGARALRDIADFHPDVYLLGACALDALAGIAAFGFDEAQFKRMLVAQSRRVISAATNDKLATGAPFAVAALRVLSDLVLEADAPQAQVSALRQDGIEIHRAAALPADES
jgi:DeoR/GlpR family transcriptional regulator of sugar metabolism